MPLTDANSILPRLDLGNLVERRELTQHITSRTGFVAGEIIGIIAELKDAVLLFNRGGRPVRLEGFGIFTPSIKLNGTINITFRPDKELIQAINKKDAYNGRIKNKQYLKKSLEELEALVAGK